MTKEKEPEVDEFTKAKQLVTQQEQEDLMTCSKDIDAILKKYGYELKVTDPKLYLSKTQ